MAGFLRPSAASLPSRATHGARAPDRVSGSSARQVIPARGNDAADQSGCALTVAHSRRGTDRTGQASTNEPGYILAMDALANASLSERERRVVEHLVERLQTELGKELVGVWLYGSRARGEEPGDDSDVDLLVVTRGGRERDFVRVLDIAMDAAEAEGVNPFDVSTMVADPGWIEGRRAIDSFFMREVDRDKIVLTGRA